MTAIRWFGLIFAALAFCRANARRWSKGVPHFSTAEKFHI